MEGPGSYPLRVAFPPLASPSLLDQVQKKVDVEESLRQLQRRRIKEYGDDLYIPPQAKVNAQAPDDTRFPLMDKVMEFLGSSQTVFLLLGDSGAGKSTFNRTLDYNLWRTYKKREGPISLFISLPSIDRPDQDLVTKQLRKADLSELQIKELKAHRKFILICDGYDESQQVNNLYVSNRLNQEGEWKAKMVISCRSEYIGNDYRDRFQPIDQNRKSLPALFQQAVVASFSEDQIHNYIKQYVTIRRPLWDTENYISVLNQIPSLKELVKNPFMLTLSLEVLPRMVDAGERLSTTQVTRVTLYDQFVEQWLERSKRRLNEKELSDQAKAAFESLSDEGFTLNGIDYLKKLSVAIFKHQGGNPVVTYSRFIDEGTWKTGFFSRNHEKQLLREANPLTRSGNQYRFIHRSMLEYGLARAVFDPQEARKAKRKSIMVRRKSVDSAFSFDLLDDEVAAKTVVQGPDLSSPLIWRNFVNEPSVLQFLEERVQREPIFKKQLLALIENSKADKVYRVGAANAITILVRAGISFNDADLKGIQIPGADLSYGVFDSSQLQGADLRKTTLRNVWLYGADLSQADMKGVQFGQLPHLSGPSLIYTSKHSPNGTLFVTGNGIGHINVYTTSNWDQIWTSSDHSELVFGVAYSPKGDFIASCSKDKTIRLWISNTGECRYVLSGHSDWVLSVAYSPKGDQIASGGKDKTVRLWSVATGTCRYILEGHTDEVNGVAYSLNGDRIASGSRDCTVRFWDTDTGNCLFNLSGHTGAVQAIVYSPKGDLLASTSRDKTVRLWDPDTGGCRFTLSGHEKEVLNVVFSPKGDLIASSSADMTARLWDAESGACRQILRGHGEWVRSVAFSPKGDMVVTGGEDRTLRMWDVDSGSCLHTLSGHTDFVSAAVFSPKGDRVISTGLDKTVRIWDVKTGVGRQYLDRHSGHVYGLAFSLKSGHVASASDDTTARLWDLETGICRHLLSGHDEWIRAIVFSPKGDRVVTGSWDKTARLWDVYTGECLFTYCHDEMVKEVAFSPDGDIVVTGCGDNAIRLWDAKTGECRHKIPDSDGKYLEFSPKGDLLASCGYGPTVYIWNVNDGSNRHTLTGPEKSGGTIRFSPDGDLLASGNDDSTVRLWDVETGACRHVLRGHEKVIRCLVFSPNGKWLASGSNDMSIRLWDVETGTCLHTFTHHVMVARVTFIRQGSVLVGSGNDGILRICDPVSGECRTSTGESRGNVQAATWITTSDAEYMVTSSNNGSIYYYQVKEEGSYSLRMHWSSTPNELGMTGTSVQGVRGLNEFDRRLVIQQGAVGEPCT